MRSLRLLLPLVLAATAPACAQAPAVDSPFAGVIERLSEPGGYFDTDNLISNEASYLHVIGGLRDLGLQGGAYVGVGPDQNFSYIAQIRPELAIIVDIRRDNLLQQLLFKALFELSADRAEYLGLLLSRHLPETRGPLVDAEQLVAHFDNLPFDATLQTAARDRIVGRLEGYGLELSDSDLATVDRFHRAFGEGGLELRFQSFGRAPQYYYPTLRDLILERDREGRQASYLASEAAFQVVRSLQLRDRIIPAVGDLAGEEALPAIARYLDEQGVPLSSFYTSNVEFYLAGDGKLDDFLANLARFPLAPNAVIIRSVFRTPLPQSVPGYGSTQLLQPIDSLLAAHADGRIRGYGELIRAGNVGF
jgi:hypothetical protein